METLTVPDILTKAKEKLIGPLLPSRDVDRAIFVGDTHTAIDVTETVFDRYYDEADVIVFLGDYVDRGKTGVENLGLIASRFLEDPHRVVMLRGNHESPLTNSHYGFLDEVNEKFGETGYEGFKQFFEAMPYAIVVNDHLCVHGGLPSGIEHVSEISKLPRPDLNPDDPIAFQLLWNDPREMIDGFIPSVRGEGAYYFGEDVTKKFLDDNSLKGIIRAHEVVDGFREDMNGKVITVFSSRYHKSSAGILVMDNDMMEQVRI